MAIITESEPQKWTSTRIAKALAKSGGPLEYRRNFVAVPNVSWGFLQWEADLLVCAKSGYVTEVEIKVSAADWKKDKDKLKWKWLADPNDAKPTRIKNFWYAAPIELARRHAEFGIPDFAGVFGVFNESGFDKCNIIKPAQPRPGARKLTDKEKLKLARLAAMRIW